MRTEEEREARKGKDRAEAEAYKAFFAANPGLVQSCRKCGDPKPLSDFVSTYAFRTTCKKCHRDRTRARRSENKDEVRRTTARQNKKSSAIILALKTGRACGACGESFPAHVMDYHHPGEKNWSVSKLHGKSERRIREEIALCVLLCAVHHRDVTQAENVAEAVRGETGEKEPHVFREVGPGDPVRTCAICKETRHRDDFSTMANGYPHSYCKPCKREYERKTNARRPRTRGVREFLRTLKESGECADCGGRFRYWQMDMDHVSEEKIGHLSVMANGAREAVLAELPKCELVCANCHRDRTAKWRETAEPCACGRKPLSRADEARHVRRCAMREPLEKLPDQEVASLIDGAGVREAELEDARGFLERHHYAGYGRSARRSYVARSGEKELAYVKFAPPVRKEVATSLGWGVDEVLELDRFCIRPRWQYPNLGSRVMSLVIRAVRRDFPDVKVLVSFADPDHGHLGGLYRASNWRHAGRTSTSYVYVAPDGSERNKKGVYEEAVRLGVRESEHAAALGLVKRPTGAKERFVYDLR
jgi:hypothetical protein